MRYDTTILYLEQIPFLEFRDANRVRLKRDFTFPGGELHIEIPELYGDEVLITTRLESSGEVMKLLLTVDALERQGVKDISLFAPYMPYARQDRVAVPGEPLSISVMANLINGCNFESVFVLDPHSSVTPALIHRMQKLDTRSFIEGVVGKVGGLPVLVAPDAGADSRVAKLALSLGLPHVVATKVRDSLTGEVKTGPLLGDVQGLDVLVVDDICDGGATFVGLADVLWKAGAHKMYLAVSHGIFSKGIQPLREAGYSRIFTTDSRTQRWDAEVLPCPTTLEDLS